VKDTQMKYDDDMKDAQERQIITNITVIAFILALLIIMVIVYSKYRSAKSRNEIIQNQMLINSYAGEINRLKDTESHESRELTKLKEKLDNLQKRQAQILANGHRVYQDILSGGTTTTWHKDDFISFIEYYRIQNLEYVIHLEKDYDSLSPKNKFFKILHHLGKSDEDISKIMAVTPTTVRVTKKRIKERKI
jgi:DNA-directed RNA polymerase specialized sigma24 family protein